jgi:hypothetical protein
MMSNFHIENGYIDLPKALSYVVSSDANFESITSNLAQEVRIFRQDTVVGHKMLIYGYEPGATQMSETR